jgi:DNA-binding NarL/FixJ family response regulator
VDPLAGDPWACPDCGAPKHRTSERCLPCGQAVAVEKLRDYHRQVDDVAVDRLISGSRVRTTRAERQAAVTYLTGHGLSARQIANRTRMSARTVQRLRSRA